RRERSAHRARARRWTPWAHLQPGARRSPADAERQPAPPRRARARGNRGSVRRALRQPWWTLPVIGLVASLPLVVRRVGDPDFFWHELTGQWMVQHRAVATHELYTYTVPGTPWTDHEYLTQLLFLRTAACRRASRGEHCVRRHRLGGLLADLRAQPADDLRAGRRRTGPVPWCRCRVPSLGTAAADVRCALYLAGAAHHRTLSRRAQQGDLHAAACGAHLGQLPWWLRVQLLLPRPHRVRSSGALAAGARSRPADPAARSRGRHLSVWRREPDHALRSGAVRLCLAHPVQLAIERLRAGMAIA